MMMKTKTLKYMTSAVLLLVATVCVAGTPRKVKVKSVVKASTGMMKASAQQHAISSASALVGTFTAVGSNLRDVDSWPVTITLDNSNSNKVWLANLSPYFYNMNYEAPAYNYFYGTLNSTRTELHIPVDQSMTGTFSFTGGGTQYTNQTVYIGAYDEYNCEAGYINVHDDDIVFRIENNGSRLVLTDSVFFYSIDSDNTFWMLDEVFNNTVLTKDGGSGIVLTQAGTLDTKISGSEESLTISGPLNGADLKVLRDMAVDKNLKHLDIGNTTIVGGNTTKYYSNYTASESNVLPQYLFYNSKLESIVLPSSITQLAISCLGYCTGLTQVTIPASVSSIASSTFSGCSALTTIDVESSSTNYTSKSGVLFSKDEKTFVKYPEGKTGTSYTVPTGVTLLLANSFSHAKITSISLPTTLTTIGGSAFSYSSITSLSLPASLTTVYTSSFSAMTALTQFTVASGNSSLSTDSRALFDKNKTVLKAYAQGNTTTSYTIPSTVTEIEYDAFWTNRYLKTITLPANVQKIGGWAFASCNSLEEINIPAKVTSIDGYAFYNNSQMKKVTSYIVTPYDVDESVFETTADVATLYVPAGKKSAYQARTGWKTFKTISEMSNSGSVTYSNGTMTVTVTTAGTLQSTIANSNYTAANAKELVINGPINGSDVRYIRQLAGINYSNTAVTATLETLNLANANIVAGGEYYKSPAYATSDNVVGLSMFADTKLKFITLPKTATTIMSQVFGNCTQLIGVTVYDKVTSVPSNLFTDCSALCCIDWQATRSLTSSMLPTASTRNPNLLIYVTSSSYAPYTTPNVVIGSTASQVTLTSGNGFWAERTFTAANISYTRSFTKTTGKGSAQGWETITLPFLPTTISHATKGELVPFGRWTGTSDSRKPFWLYGFGAGGFTASNYLYANQPYLIAMPNNTSYDDAYRVNGTITFSATNATVPSSSAATATSNGVRTLRPTFLAVASASDKYAMNAAGSQFVTYRAVAPFEAYFTTTASNARDVMDIFEELPTGLDAIPTVDTETETIYDLQGRKVETPQRGIYVKNGRKVVVK